MSKFLKVASLLFEGEHLQGHLPDLQIRSYVFDETRRRLDALRGCQLNLVVLSEAIEALGQTNDNAEEISRPGRFLQLYCDFARSEKCMVAGPLKLREGGRIHNSLAFINADGAVCGAYHKSHLTPGELDAGLSPGESAVVVEMDSVRLGGAICFDLNFETLRREYAKLKPDILVFPSMYHGGLVQQMWAYECRAFFVSALPFFGGGILDPFGNPLALTDCYNKTAVAQINLDRAVVHLDYNSDKFSGIRNKYGSDVRIQIPANFGSALLTSESAERSALDIVAEFGLELLDDYFVRAQRANEEKRTTR